MQPRIAVECSINNRTTLRSTITSGNIDSSLQSWPSVRSCLGSVGPPSCTAALPSVSCLVSRSRTTTLVRALPQMRAAACLQTWRSWNHANSGCVRDGGSRGGRSATAIASSGCHSNYGYRQFVFHRVNDPICRGSGMDMGTVLRVGQNTGKRPCIHCAFHASRLFQHQQPSKVSMPGV